MKDATDGSDNEFFDVGLEARDTEINAVKSTMFAAKDKDPSKMVEVVNLSRQAQLPPDVVERQFDTVKKDYGLAHNDYDKIVDETPGLAQWLRDPSKAAVGKNELDGLGQIDKSARMIMPREPETSTFQDGRMAVETGYRGLESSTWNLAAMYGMANIDEAAIKIAEANKRQNDLAAMKPTYAKEFDKVFAKESEELGKAISEFTGGIGGGVILCGSVS